MMLDSRLVFLLVYYAPCLSTICATSTGMEYLYQQPMGQVDVPGHVYANPSPWPLPNRSETTYSVCWQRCCIGQSTVHTPFADEGAVASLTGVAVGPQQQAVVSPKGSGVPWSAVQFSEDGVWGGVINTTGADPAKEPLTTTTLESSWGGQNCVQVFAKDSNSSSSNAHRGFAVELFLAVPTAFHGPRSQSVPAAVYVSLSVYLRSVLPPTRFIWYSTNLFDLDRDVVTDHVFIDTSSKKLIVSGPISGHSAYNSAQPGSELARNTTTPGTHRIRFAYNVTSEHVEQGIRDGLKQFPGQLPDLPMSASSYCLPGFNIELEATPGAGAGISVSGLNISVI